jgi:hypothetical protein
MFKSTHIIIVFFKIKILYVNDYSNVDLPVYELCDSYHQTICTWCQFILTVWAFHKGMHD